MLTANQEKFVQNILQGMSQADAYRSAYPKNRMSDKTLHEAASRLMGNSKVIARLTELRNELASPAIMSAQERLEFLTQVINGTKGELGLKEIEGEIVEVEVPASIKVRLNAIDIMNKMTGEYVTEIKGKIGIAKLEDLI